MWEGAGEEEKEEERTKVVDPAAADAGGGAERPVGDDDDDDEPIDRDSPPRAANLSIEEHTPLRPSISPIEILSRTDTALLSDTTKHEKW